MAGFKLKPHYLGVFFVAAVIIPSVILGLVGIRAISREEAYIEKQLEGTLLAEVTHVTLVNTQLKEIQKILSDTSDISEIDDPVVFFSQWKERSSLVVFAQYLVDFKE